MNKEEILAMESGSDRKLDILVHEQIMHRTVPVDHDITDRFCDCVPRYSTDISAAWQVVEKFSSGYRIVISTTRYPWDCRIYADDKELRCVADASGKTAPEAICKAALLATIEEAQ